MRKKINKKKSGILTYKENQWYSLALAISFVLFLIFFTTFKITGDDDVFWHLETGRYIVTTHHVPSTDIFGYITQGQPWMPFEWGWDVLTYGIYLLFGYTGLSILRTLILLLVFLIYYLIYKKFKIPDSLIFLFNFFFLFAIMDRLTPRPHLMSYLFFALLLYMIINFRYFHRDNIKKLYFVPLIFLLWANLHMGIIAGAFILGIYVFSEIITFLFPKKFASQSIFPLKKNQLIILIGIGFLSLVAMLINPNGLATYLYAYSHTNMKMLVTVNEWMAPFSAKYTDSFVSIIYKVFLFSGVIILYHAYKTKDVFSAILYIFFAIYSVRAMRFTTDYILIVSPFILFAIYFILNKSLSQKTFINIFKKPFLKIGLIVVYLALIIPVANNSLYLEFLKYYRITGVGINNDFIPEQLFKFMKDNNVPDIGSRIFNHFGTGGYFIWNFPGKQNFIDSRNLNDDIFFKYYDILNKNPGFEQKLNDYGIDYAIYLAPDLVRGPQEMETTVISYFSKSPDWKLIFWDDKSFLWVKNVPKFQDLINRYEYKYITPYNYAYQKNLIDKGIREDKEKVKSEIKRKLDESDNNSVVINSILKVFGNRIN